MGTLDDAIREHLELKRRAGASSDEVRRLESEALGPARRDAPPPEAPAAREPEALGDEGTRVRAAPAPAAAEPAGKPEAPAAEPSRDPDWLEADPFGDAPAESERVDQPAEGEDVLEETPDFLQETPEHDRLWFEQRPPRDFDFDE